MADIFISYAREDEVRIQPLVRVLENRAWSIFWDRHIPAGQTWRSYIGKALGDARCVIVAWSRDSIVSDWVSEEADEGKKRGILIPVLLDAVEPPIGFRSIQAADLTDWQSDRLSPHFEKLLHEIRGVLQAPPTPTPTLAPPTVVPGKTGPSKARRFPLLRILLLVALVVGGTTAILKWMAGHSSAPQPAPTLAPTPTALIAGKSTPIATPESSPTIQTTDVPSTNIDKPTLLTSNEIRGNGVGEDISYYYTFNAGPGTVKVTVDGKNKPGGLTNAVGVEISDLDAKRLLYIHMGNTTIDKRKVERFQLGRRQQVIMRILLDELTLDYMVRLEGPIDFSPTTKVQGAQ